MSAAAILALALALQPPAPAPAWQGLGTHEAIDTSYDPASVQRMGERRVRVRIRGVIATPGADEIKTATGLIEIDCAAGTATPIEVRGTDANGGLVLNALVPAAERRPQPIRPASPNAAVRDAVCGAPSGQ